MHNKKQNNNKNLIKDICVILSSRWKAAFMENMKTMNLSDKINR